VACAFFWFYASWKYLCIHTCIHNIICKPPMAQQYPEERVPTPRDSPQQLMIRSRYTGPKNDRGEPDTTRTDEIGVIDYPSNNGVYKLYSGQWRNGEFDGQGTVIFTDDDTYIGGFKDGKLHGHGVYKHSNGVVREGEFIDDDQVSGTLIRPDCTFQGTFLAGMEHTGTFTYTDGVVFTGTRESDTKRVGTVRYPDGDIFSGTFEDWELNGDDAKMIVNSVSEKFIYKGQMQNGRKHGIGTIQIMSGPRMGEHYSAKFIRDKEVINSRVDIPNKGGTRCNRTRFGRKRLRSSKRK